MHKIVLVLLAILVTTGCSLKPYHELDLDTTTNISVPTQGYSGIYVYQWGMGSLFAAIRDIDFEINREVKASLNTGEHEYIELKPGTYEFKSSGGAFFDRHFKVEFEANKNYFFRGYIYGLADHFHLVRSQIEINQAKKLIRTGQYEKSTMD